MFTEPGMSPSCGTDLEFNQQLMNIPTRVIKSHATIAEVVTIPSPRGGGTVKASQQEVFRSVPDGLLCSENRELCLQQPNVSYYLVMGSSQDH